MKIQDDRWTGTRGMVNVDDCRIGDVVETEHHDVCLVVWSNQRGEPHTANPGYPGLLSLKTNKSYLSREEFPKVRKINAKLVIEDTDPI